LSFVLLCYLSRRKINQHFIVVTWHFHYIDRVQEVISITISRVPNNGLIVVKLIKFILQFTYIRRVTLAAADTAWVGFFCFVSHFSVGFGCRL